MRPGGNNTSTPINIISTGNLNETPEFMKALLKFAYSVIFSLYIWSSLPLKT